ncbi:O-linked N-acetylglucosamine transferase, SPINDLY family protein [Chamaesiphon sp. OTE_20_metabat_361]|uniref:O-linked N-acetylglucosamine transferase, SPINDLY family protein n=1 Tax=Chamaesiphon sp. OTE_20_metabat_361 TaxID=2964689 RepID=UPI00286AC0EF|nr:O-linked N-acetylglucosamine transferase, SPINDLY family protein [Chamaesiphon sp. OTE_20_metabat_361]
MQVLHLPQSSIDRQFDPDRLDQTIEYYETIIDRGDEAHLNYWYLGIAYLLQEREIDAQATWFIPFERVSEKSRISPLTPNSGGTGIESPPELGDLGGVWVVDLTFQTPFENDSVDVEALTHDLASTLDRIATEKLTLNCLDNAWLISQYLREVDAAHLNNLFRSILLEIKLERFDPETLPDLDAATILGDAENREFDRQLLANLLTAILYYPSTEVCEFIEQCLIYLPKCQDESIAIVVDAVLALEHKFGSQAFFIEALEKCLAVQPDNIATLNALSKLYCNDRDYQQAINIANRAYELCGNLISKIVTNNTIIRAILTSGDWLNADGIIDRHYRLLSELVDREDELLPANTSHLVIGAAVFIACVTDRPEYFRSLQNQIAKKYLQSTQYRLPNRSRSVGFAQSIAPSSLAKRSGVIRIGYLASTLRKHSVGWLSRWLWQYYDREKFQVFNYCINQNPDDPFYQQWFGDRADVSYCFGDNVDEIIDRIQADEIDILVDLDSLTLNLTAKILAAKPAPVQVSWLGWDATGLPTVDYFMADRYVLPDNAQEYYQEKIWRLPHSYLAVNGFEIGIATLKRRDLNIPDDAIIYWSGQVGHKRHPDTVRSQLRILKAVPNSYFLIKGDTDPQIVREFFGRIAAEEGVEFDRLRFLGKVADEYTHRANLAIADIVLDTFPYNGATTTLETLWMGIPMVTQVGQQFAARNSYTFMVNAGIEEGIAWNAQEYVEWGVKLGLDRELRMQVREKLRLNRQTAPVWNAKQFTLDMEAAYRQMWAIYQAKQQEVVEDDSNN